MEALLIPLYMSTVGESDLIRRDCDFFPPCQQLLAFGNFVGESDLIRRDCDLVLYGFRREGQLCRRK